MEGFAILFNQHRLTKKVVWTDHHYSGLVLGSHTTTGRKNGSQKSMMTSYARVGVVEDHVLRENLLGSDFFD